MNWLRHLTFAKFEFLIEARQPLLLPRYKGSTFRGAFGNIFKHIVCIKEDRECRTCILTQNCSYYYIFETPHSGKFSWFDSPKLPHPYILEPPDEERELFQPGEQLRFNLTLVGRAIDYLPYFIFVFDEMGRRGGIGKYRKDGFGRFRLQEVRDVLARGKQLYDGRSKTLIASPKVGCGAEFFRETGETEITQLHLNFRTPTRIRHNGNYLLFDGNKNIPVRVLLENIYRRTYLMTFTHCCDAVEPFEMPDFSAIAARRANLRWQDWQRYSNRQQRKHYFGGFLGDLTLEGELNSCLPLLRAGEIVHAGSATSFGLGRFVVG